MGFEEGTVAIWNKAASTVAGSTENCLDSDELSVRFLRALGGMKIIVRDCYQNGPFPL
jgi:hypothetical protein